jgi:MFS family permease
MAMEESAPKEGKPKGVRAGIILAISGLAFGIAPLAISLLAAALGSDIGNVLHWFTLMTAPIGIIASIVGLVMAARSTSKEPVKLRGKLRNQTPDLLPAPSRGVTRTLRIVYVAGAIIVAASALLRVTIFQPNSGIVILIDMTPAFLAALLAKKALAPQSALTFLQFHKTQAIICWGGLVLSGPIGLLGASSSLAFINDEDIVVSQLIGTAITGLTPAAACLASLIFAATLKTIYLKSTRNQANQ